MMLTTFAGKVVRRSRHRWVTWFLLWGICAAAGSARAQEASLLELIKALQAKEASLRAESEANRVALVEKMYELNGRERALATTELSKKDRERGLLRQRIEMQKLMLGNFASKHAATPTSQRVSKYIADLDAAKANSERLFREHQHDSRGAIESGRSLNFFLTALGAVALDHLRWRETTELELKRDDLSPEELAELQERLRIIERVSGKNVLTEHHRGQLQLMRPGTQGRQLVVTGRSIVEQIDWPYELRNTESLSGEIERFEAAMREFVEGLRRPPGPESAKQIALSGAMASLKNAFDLHYAQRATQVTDNTDVRRLVEARTFLARLATQVEYLVELRDFKEIATEEFAGTRIEQLLAFMTRNGFQFAPARPTGASTYMLLHTLLADYYANLLSLQYATESAEDDDRYLRQRADRLFEVAYRRTNDFFGVEVNQTGGGDAWGQVRDVSTAFRDFAVGAAQLNGGNAKPTP